MRPASFLGVFLALACVAPGPAWAVLGETRDALQKRFGRPDPQLRPQKNVTMWSIETDASERLLYTVTFDEQGRSIGEGLKPVRNARLVEKVARAFIDSQLAPYAGSETMRTVKPGEKYVFAGQEFTCGKNEEVMLDPANDIMIVWLRGRESYVLAVRAAMLAGGQ